MKITEVSSSTISNVNEGPMDIARSVAGAVASPIKTAAQALDRRAGNKQIDDITKRLMVSWQQQVAAQNAAGNPMNDPKVYQDKILKWMSTAAFGKDLGVIQQKMGPLPGVGAGAINEYLRKAVGLHMAGEFEGDAAEKPDTTANVKIPVGDPVGNTSGNTAGNTSGNASTTTTAVDPSREPLFKDANLFKAEWDKYVAAQTQPYQLISDVRMLDVLKDMWMRTGGTKLAGNELPKTVNDKFGNPVQQPANGPAPGAPYQRKTFRFNEGKKAK